jgi:ABC-type transport system substrate-binding protein
VHLTPLPEDLIQEAAKRGFKTIQGRVPAFRLVMNFKCCQYIDPFNISLGYKNPASPLMDVRVRQLLNKAINRDELNKNFFGGKGEISINQPFHPTRQGWNPEWEKRFPAEYGYDPAKAKALLAESGFGPGNPLKVNLELTPARGTTNSEDIIEAVGNYWRAIGIDVTFVVEPNAAKRDTFTDHIYLQDSGSEEWTGSYVAGGSRLSKSANMTISAADDILDQIAVTLDDKKRDELYRQMANINFDQRKHIQLLWINPEVVVNGDIVADYLFPGNITGGWTHIEYITAVR